MRQPKDPLVWEDIKALQEWSVVNGESLPESVRRGLAQCLTFLAFAHSLLSAHRLAVKTLRQALGIETKSEKSRGYGAKPVSDDAIAKLKRATKNAIAAQNRALRHKREETNMNAEQTDKSKSSSLMEIHQRLADEAQAALAADDKLEEIEPEKHEGDEVPDQNALHLSVPASTLFGTCLGTIASQTTTVRVNEAAHFSWYEVPRYRTYEAQKRLTFDLTVTEEHFDVETVYSPLTGKRVTASMDEHGPRGFNVTWLAVVNAVILSVGFFMPLHRISRLLMGKFHPSRLHRMVQLCAERLLPLYKHFIEEASEADVFNIDDTSARVLEVSKFLKEEAKAAENESAKGSEGGEQQERPMPPWESDSPLVRETRQLLGYRFDCADEERRKIGVYTSVVIARWRGRTDSSPYILYRTHLGSAGNFLEKILENRRCRERKIVVTSDLLSANKIRAKDILSAFSIVSSGCAAHARRPFAKHQEDDPELCNELLEHFSTIALTDKKLRMVRMSVEKAKTTRAMLKGVWGCILFACENHLDKWKSKTPLGGAIRYIIKHIKPLTYPTDDPWVDSTNNLAERALRTENLARKNSLFSKSLTGRTATDILRTVFMTCQAQGISPKAYLLWVLKKRPEDLQESPERFTPQAFLASQHSDKKSSTG